MSKINIFKIISIFTKKWHNFNHYNLIKYEHFNYKNLYKLFQKHDKKLKNHEIDKLHINPQPYLKSNANEMTKRLNISQQKVIQIIVN